jgi:hypothetical protein
MKIIMVHLWHPCREIDVWTVETEEDKAIAISQGYVTLENLRTSIEELERYVNPVLFLPPSED